MVRNIFRVIAFAVILYQVVLLTMGVKTITGIADWQAFVTVAISLVAGVFIAGVIFVMIEATVSPVSVIPIRAIPTQ